MITKLEKNVLKAFNTNYMCAEDEKEDNATYTDINDIKETTNLSVETIKGALGSLTKKGLVNPCIDLNSLTLSDEGIDEFYKD